MISKISFSFFILFIFIEVLTSTFNLSSSFCNASKIIVELWFTGNTLNPSLAIVATPIEAKKASKSSLEKLSNASFMNLPLLPNLVQKSSWDKVFVRLHFPPPVAFSFSAICGIFSIINTFLSSFAALILAIIPAGPAPTTIKS